MSIPSGILTGLPEATVEDLIGVVEVLIQEQLPNFVAPISRIGELRQIFSSRAKIGAIGIQSLNDLEKAHDLGAEFVFADFVDAEMVAVAQSYSVPLYGSALTPTEIRRVLSLGATGALLWPADIVGHGMATHLAGAGLADKVIPMGGLGAYAAGEWLKAGSPAACVDKSLIDNAIEDEDLEPLRQRCESFRLVLRQSVES